MGTNTYWQPARRPRAGVAIGAAILAAWVGAVGVSFATDDSSDSDRGAAQGTRPELVWPGYFSPTR